MRKVIINADDFGLTMGCSLGIIKALKEGLVTSTTIMMNMPKTKDSIQLAKENMINAMGVHLNLTAGRPLSPTNEIPSLLDKQGRFNKTNIYPSKTLNLNEVERELERQINAFLDNKLELTHLDSHHHVHMNKGIKDVCIDLARKYDLPLRLPHIGNIKSDAEYGIVTPHSLSCDFYNEGATMEQFKKIIDGIARGITEIMTHPGIVDDELTRVSSYNHKRGRELEILTDKRLIDWMGEKDIQLISFKDL